MNTEDVDKVDRELQQAEAGGLAWIIVRSSFSDIEGAQNEDLLQWVLYVREQFRAI